MRLVNCLVGASVMALSLMSCGGIQYAPRDVPRVEVEVVYEVDGSFYEPFHQSENREAIAAAVRQAIEPLADVGLRFYATPAESYGGSSKRPQYLMTVRATTLEVNRSIDTPKAPTDGTEAAPPTARLRRAVCGVRVRLEKRRPNAPRLTVCDVDGIGAAAPESGDASPMLLLKPQANESNETHVSDRMLRFATAQAATIAFSRVQVPFDRELVVASAPAK